jgi:DNA-binding NarL/FixJ family response regulator
VSIVVDDIARQAVRLSPREAAVCVCVACGLRDKQIAAELAISEHTVRGYLTTAFLKAQLNERSGRAALVSWCYQQGVFKQGKGSKINGAG